MFRFLLRAALGVLSLWLVAGQITGAQPASKIQVLILSGQNNHDWRATTPVLKDILERTGRFEVRVNEEPSGCGAETFAHYDVLVTNYNGPRWGGRTEQAVLNFVRGGKGLVVVHAANNAFPDWKEYDRLIGGAWREGARHQFKVAIRDREHPITKGMPDFLHGPDELYHRLAMQPNIHLLATAFSANETGGTGREEPIVWTVTHGKGRVFHNVLGHDVEAMQGKGFATLMQRGAEWAATGKVTLPVPGELLRAARPVRVLVWSEGTAPKNVYPHDINGAIAEYLNTCEGSIAKAASLKDPDQGLSDTVLSQTDVLIWWGHVLHGEVTDEAVDRIVRHVKERGMGFIALHSSHWSKPFTRLMGTSGNWRAFREDGKPEYIHVAAPGHPIAEGISDFAIPQTEMYADPFEVPEPEALIFTSRWDAGETARSGLTWKVGKGRVFYFRPGHETYPIFFNETVRKILRNAVLWAAG